MQIASYDLKVIENIFNILHYKIFLLRKYFNYEFKFYIVLQVEVAMFRDLDSRPSQREVDAVHEWLQSKHAFHVMRDHPGHDLPMLAGMWGLKLAGPSSGGNLDDLRPILRRVFLAILRSQSFTSLMADPRQDINRVSSFSRCPNGTFS